MGNKKSAGKVRYFQDEVGGFIGITGHRVPKLPDVYVGRGPLIDGQLESVEEQAYHVNHLRRWVEVNATDVPAEWMQAIGYEKPPEPEPDPEPPDPSEPAVLDITWWPFYSPPRRRSTKAERLVAQLSLLTGVLVVLIGKILSILLISP